MSHNAKYNTVVMRFYYYYKYTFYFKGTTFENGAEIEVGASVGGSSDDIYRFEISTNSVYRLGEGVDGFEFENVTVTEKTK